MVTDLRLFNFRSYTQAAFEFGEGVNIIVGPNASGKTNLLEAVLVVCSGSSYRVKDADLISFEQPWARLESDTPEGARKVTIERAEDLTKKKFTINSAQQSRLSLQKKIPVVVFEPEHLRLLHGGPENRRSFLDSLLEQTVPGYGKLLRDYKRTLAQRNAVLKQTTAGTPSQLFAWDVRLSELGAKIVQERVLLVAELKKRMSELYSRLAHNDFMVDIEYISDCDTANYSSQMLHRLSVKLETDRLRGFTSTGPHRHDFQVYVDGHPASLAASRGESRTLLLALKLLELERIELVRNKKPVLLLDDVFSELDGARRKALTTHLKDYQTFITTTDADIVVQHFMGDCTIIPLSS
ncbi:DNA replication and repair protein RecF [Candidatus Saccharibacteria bacterium]|nr:MAG: DNA replication and repair protein RecF [Candidatus Saccharibacteria bacterium]